MRILILSGLESLLIAAAGAQSPRGSSAVSAPITDVRYEVTADSAACQARRLGVTTTFHVGSNAPVILSLPAWSPGHYVLLWFAGRVSAFAAQQDGTPLEWRKQDFQTWVIRPSGPGIVRVSFRYQADAIDRAIAWTAPNFAFFNGTNLFLYPVGRGFDWPAQVTVRTEPTWRVTTGMMPAGAPNVFHEANYHDLVDMPFYVGRYDLDSTRASNHWIRYALFPAGAMTRTRRDSAFSWLKRILPAHASVFGEIPFDNYTVFVRSDTIVNGGGLEHSRSQVDEVLRSQLDGLLAGLFSHEMFHAWNVKRLRPAEMVPYRYDDAQPTPWLWVSEGVTDYYGGLALTRSGILDSAQAMGQVVNWISGAESSPAAVADASLGAWIPLFDGSAGLYYPKGATLGFLIDVLIRDGSNNRHSLDDVMRELYQSTYKQGRGFTKQDWWSAVARNSGRGQAYWQSFSRHYVEGRDPLPLDSVMALAGLRLERSKLREVRFGFATQVDSTGVIATAITPGTPAASAGLHAGDRVVSIGSVMIVNADSLDAFRARYEGTTASTLPIVVRRGGETLTLSAPVQLVPRPMLTVVPVAGADSKAAAIRHGIFFR